MQKNCEKLKLPFEVLIQGPSGDRFIRSLINADPVYESILEAEPQEERKTRSTITIYRPEKEAEEETLQLESEVATGGDASPAESDDIVTMVHQPQAEALKTESLDDLLLDADERELTLDGDVEETESQGTKREAIFKGDSDVADFADIATDTLVEESALNKRQADGDGGDADGGDGADGAPAADEDVGAARVIVQPTTTTPAPTTTTAAPIIPPKMAKQQAVINAMNQARSNLQTLKENAADKRKQINEIVGVAMTDVRAKISALPTKPPLPTLAPLPINNKLRKLFSKNNATAAEDDATVGAVRTALPVPNLLPLQFGNRAILPSSSFLPIAPVNARIQNINTNLALRKVQAQAQLQANLQANKAALQANGLLPVVSYWHWLSTTYLDSNDLSIFSHPVEQPTHPIIGRHLTRTEISKNDPNLFPNCCRTYESLNELFEENKNTF